MISFEIPTMAIQKLSIAFRIMENAKVSLQIQDYALSQSTLEQVFLKQIQPSENDKHAIKMQQNSHRSPNFSDYFMIYIVWLVAFLIPGLHHFYLGNTWRGVKYVLTLNEAIAGWILDFFELHILLQKSVDEYGHTSGCCGCCKCCCCCCCCCGTTNHEEHGTSSLAAV